MTRIGDIIDGKYEILKQIGKGGMSVVYLAMDKRLNKQWAVKEISKRVNGKNNEIVVNSLLAEANLMKRLDHPALPRIVDIIDNSITIYIIMDYIEGESLDKILLEYGAQPEELVLEWAKQLCDALEYLHSQNPPIIYRDMKPANIMLKPEGNLKVIDFGIAREYKEKNLTDTTVLGTKGYASPEHYGSRQTDARSDIFTLGMTLHHLLTGIDPRTNNYMYASVRQWNPELSDGIEAIIDKCTALDPEDRYQNCSELMYDLEHPDLITKDYRQKQKKKLRLFAISAMLAVAMGIIGIGSLLTASIINGNDYEKLTTVVTTTSFEEKVEGYKKAVEIYPDDTKAYFCMLEAYESEGRFGKKENDELMALYNKNKDGFEKDDAAYAKLNYIIGMMYFNYYSDNDGSYSFSDRVQKAYPFFANNYENKELAENFKQRALSDCYYRICQFYKKYILNSLTVEEASRDDYMELFKTIEKTIDAVKNMGAYDQLALYNGAFLVLYDQRASMESVNVDQQRILTLMDKIYSNASALSVKKEQSKKLRMEIVDNYRNYREAVQRTYSNAENMEMMKLDSMDAKEEE